MEVTLLGQTEGNTPAPGADIRDTPGAYALKQKIDQALGLGARDQSPSIGCQFQPPKADHPSNVRQRLTNRPPGDSALEESFRLPVDEPFSSERNIHCIPVRYACPEKNGFPARL